MISLFASTAATMIAMLLLSIGSALAAGQLFTHENVTLRRGPAASFASLTTLPSGAPITVLWCNSAADWCLIDDGAEQGWAPLTDLRGRSTGTAGTDDASPTIDAGDIPASAPDARPGAEAGTTSGTGGAGVSFGSASVSVSTPAASAGIKAP